MRLEYLLPLLLFLPLPYRRVGGVGVDDDAEVVVPVIAVIVVAKINISVIRNKKKTYMWLASPCCHRCFNPLVALVLMVVWLLCPSLQLVVEVVAVNVIVK